MKILHLAYNDVAGVPGRWERAHREAGHETCLLFEIPHDYGYRSDALIERWSANLSDPERGAERLDGTLDWADVIMAYDHPFYLQVALTTGKPVLFRALGTAARENADELRDLLQHPLVMRASTGTVDLAEELDLEHVGAPYPLLPPALATNPVLVHAPSNRNLKRTDLLLAAAHETRWRIDLVEDTANPDILARKAVAVGVLDSGPGSLPDGYGVNSVEAMAMGLPAVAGATVDAETRLRAVGCPVLFVQSYDQLVGALERLQDPRERQLLGIAGALFVESFHNGKDRAHEDEVALAVLQEAA